MTSENDYELPQTQSQSNNLDETFSQLDENCPEAWGRLTNKNRALRTVGALNENALLAQNIQTLCDAQPFLISTFFIQDLRNDSYTVGRSASCDYDLDKCGIKEKLLVQISKNHFKITRDLSAIDNPVYIEVVCFTLKYQSI